MGRKKIVWDESAGADENARATLPLLAAAYFSRVRKALEDDPQPRDLHRVRLETKRFRYTLELFEQCYGPAFQKRIGSLRKIQSLLGDLNDLAATARMLPRRADARAELERLAGKKAKEFRRHWTVFDAPGEEMRWIKCLARTNRKTGP